MANRTLLPSAASGPQYSEAQLHGLAQRIVEQCHAKTRPMANGLLPEAPIGRGGKKDDTSCVVAEVVEWTEEMQKMWEPEVSSNWLPFTSLDAGLFNFNGCCVATHDSDDEADAVKPSFHPSEGSPGGASPEWKDFPRPTPGPAPMAMAPHHSPGQQMFGMNQFQGHPHPAAVPGVPGVGVPGMLVNGMPYPMNPYMKPVHPAALGPTAAPFSRFALNNFMGSQCGNAPY